MGCGVMLALAPDFDGVCIGRSKMCTNQDQNVMCVRSEDA